MKKGLVLSIVCCSFVYGAGFVHPLPMSSRSTENGGTLSAIDAYQDGVGAMVVQQGRGIDNSAMNALVFKYGNIAKTNTLSVGDQVILTGTSEDKLLAGKLFADGVSCNDGNPLSTGETYLNGVCQGGLVPNGTICDDLNSNTIYDVYVNQSCIGKITATPTCSDGSMTWNTTTKICEKGSISTYTAPQVITGYTISGNSTAGGWGMIKNGNTFYLLAGNGGTSPSAYLTNAGTISISMSTNWYLHFEIYSVNTFYMGWNSIYSGPTTRSGTSITQSISANGLGLQKVDENTFRFVNGATLGAVIQWVPVTNGTYNCPSGGTLSGTTCTINTYSSATGICQAGYTLNTSLGKCVQN